MFQILLTGLGVASLKASSIHTKDDNYNGFPVAQLVEHGASNAKIMGLIPRESKSWSNVKL